MGEQPAEDGVFIADDVSNIVKECLDDTLSSKEYNPDMKTGAGLHTAASCYWDSSTDGSRTVRWESKTMYCVSTVFGLSM